MWLKLRQIYPWQGVEKLVGEGRYNRKEERVRTNGANYLRKLGIGLVAAGFAWLGCASPSMADQVINDDLIVDGSICAGMDCVNGESFGFDTLRLKENNLRIKFQDTSASSSFPSNDWQITANDSSNGGANKFSIDDIDGGRTPFTIRAGAPSNSLFVDSSGRLGLGTSSPVVNLHVVTGNTPTLRLEQNGSSGFTAQTWDVAGNEAGFFVRDTTNGSTLPFRILPGAASQSLVIDGDDEVGIGAGTNPTAALHVKRTNNTAQIFVEDTGTTAQDLLVLQNAGPARFALNNNAAGNLWRFNSANDGLRISLDGSATVAFILDTSENLTIQGDIMSNGTTVIPDYVFEPDYQLMPIDELAAFIEQEKHLPNVPSAKEVKETGGVNMTEMQMKLLEKVEELTLYTLEQEKTINELQERLAALE